MDAVLRGWILLQWKKHIQVLFLVLGLIAEFTVGIKVIRAFEISCVKKFISNAVL